MIKFLFCGKHKVIYSPYYSLFLLYTNFYQNRSSRCCVINGYGIRACSFIQQYRLVTPTLAYAAEIWTLDITDVNILRIFEKTVIWTNQQTGIRINLEINAILKEETIIIHIKSLKLGQVGHVERIERKIIPKSQIQGVIPGTTWRGIQNMKLDLKIIKTR